MSKMAAKMDKLMEKSAGKKKDSSEDEAAGGAAAAGDHRWEVRDASGRLPARARCERRPRRSPCVAAHAHAPRARRLS